MRMLHRPTARVRVASLFALATLFPAASVVAQTAVDLPTGVRISFEAQGPEGDPPLVLLHGYPDSGYSFSRIVPLLPPDRRIIVPDFRGHGRSSRPPAGYAVADLATDVLALLDALHVESAVLLGHSMGSLVAQRIAAVAPERVEALVLVGSAPSIRGMTGMDEFREVLEGLSDPVPDEFVRAFQESTIARPVPAEFMDAIVRESLRLPVRSWRQVFAGMLGAPELAVGQITVRTLLLWGSEDGVFGREQQARLLELIPGARLHVYDGVGHAPHWEDPEAFTADVVAFLREGESSASG